VQVGDHVPLERGEFADQVQRCRTVRRADVHDRGVGQVDVVDQHLVGDRVSVPAGDLDRAPDAHRGHHPGELIPGDIRIQDDPRVGPEEPGEPALQPGRPTPVNGLTGRCIGHPL